MNFSARFKLLKDNLEKSASTKTVLLLEDIIKMNNLLHSRSKVWSNLFNLAEFSLDNEEFDKKHLNVEMKRSRRGKKQNLVSHKSKFTFWQQFKSKPEGELGFCDDNNKCTYALNGIDHVLFAQEQMKRYETNYAGAIVIDDYSKYAPNVVTADFQSLYPTMTILFNIDSSSIGMWSEFKIFIRELNIYVDPFDDTYIRKESCQLKINGSYMNILCFFIRPNIVKSLTSQLQVNLAKERAKIRNIIKQNRDLNEAEYQYYDACQSAIKRIMNSIYGATGTTYYCSCMMAVASEITKKARNALFSLYMYFYWYCWNRNLFKTLDIVYGDTDSLFANFSSCLEMPKEYFAKLAFEFKKYSELWMIYEKDLLLNADQLSEHELKSFVLKKWNIEIIGDYDCTLDDCNESSLSHEKQQTYLLNPSDTSESTCRFKTLKELLVYNGADKWKLTYKYLSIQPRAFDNSIYIYIVHDILHKYGQLPRNRLLKQNHTWSDLTYDFRENEYEFIGANNLDKISEKIVVVNLERLIHNFFLFKMKNYVGSASDGIYSRGGVLFNSRQPKLIKNFLNSIWQSFQTPSKYLNDCSRNRIRQAFDDFVSCPDDDFFSTCRIGKALDKYKMSNAWLDQLQLINRLKLDQLGEGDVFQKAYFNYFFQGPFIGQKIDPANKFHLSVLRKKKESNMLLVSLVNQVKETLTEQDLDLYRANLSQLELDELLASGNLIKQAKAFFFKFGIDDLVVNKEMLLRKNVNAAIVEFIKVFKCNSLYFQDFEQVFNETWIIYFGNSFTKSRKLNGECKKDNKLSKKQKRVKLNAERMYDKDNIICNDSLNQTKIEQYFKTKMKSEFK